MLQGMIQRGATIFLTTHVLEIVERLCSHVAIISQGGWWRTGRWRNCAPAWPAACRELQGEQRLTLEEMFLSIVGAGGGEPAQELSWLA